MDEDRIIDALRARENHFYVSFGTMAGVYLVVKLATEFGIWGFLGGLLALVLAGMVAFALYRVTRELIEDAKAHAWSAVVLVLLVALGAAELLVGWETVENWIQVVLGG